MALFSIPANLQQVGAFLFGQKPPLRRPGRLVVRRPGRDLRPGRGRPRPQDPQRRGDQVTAVIAAVEPVQVVRQRPRPERRQPRDRGGHHRAARPERRRQVDLHEARHRPDEAGHRHRDRPRPAGLERSRSSSGRSGSAPSRTSSTRT